MKKMPNLYMMIGLPGSGKSYYARTLARDTKSSIVSSDTIRETMFGDVNDQEHNNEVFEEVHKRINAYLKDGKDCIYDATNLSRKRRRGFLNTLGNYKDVKKIAVLMCTDIDICLKQNKQRDRNVPEDVIMRMFRHLSFPKFDEGFDEIITVSHKDNPVFMQWYFEKTIDFDQDNEHHSLPLNEHLQKALDIVREINAEDTSITTNEFLSLSYAALYHDIGKVYCKTYEKYDGTIDTQAHFYNHADVGAYIMTCCLFHNITNHFDREKIRTKLNVPETVIPLILYHMDFFSMSEEALMKKVTNMYGERFALMLKYLHRADTEAH